MNYYNGTRFVTMIKPLHYYKILYAKPKSNF
jgi:hypothetical protein